MSELSKKINKLLKLATKSEVQEIKDKIYISEHLEEVFNLFYIQKQDIEFIAYKTGYSIPKINQDLKLIREKINKLL